MDDAYLAGPVTALDEVEERLRADLVDAGLRLDRAKWLTYAEPAVRFAVTHTRNAQGLEPWAWGASVQRGGVISFASVDGLEEEEEGDRAIGYGLHVQGVPVGENAFLLHELDRLKTRL